MNAFYPLTRRLTAALVGALALIGLAAPAQAQANCETGSAETTLDINNVSTKLFNIGSLFWRAGNGTYEVPKGSGLVSIFASGIWVGGQVDGDLRFAGSTYGPWEYWPGPLTANGTVSRDVCAEFDRFWKVNISDIRTYLNEGRTTSDLSSWPIAYGAPFFVDTNGNGRRDATLDANGDGTPDEPRIELDIDDAGYGTRQLDLAGGELPDIIGDQGIWWVMNDMGGAHGWSEAEAIGLEVRAHAFAFASADALNNTTFYRFQFVYRGSQDMENTYIGIFSDPDLGEFNDDFIGSDPELGLGFVYNGDNFDDGGGGYGPVPPALGYDFFQGPLVGNGAGSAFNDGVDNDGDGEVDEENERLAIEKFFYFTNTSGITGDPSNAEEAYFFMRGLWPDGTPLKEGGNGYDTNGPQVDYAFPGDPPGFWSEYNVDGTGQANTPADRRFGVSSGPFTFQPGQIQEVVFGIIWSQAQGATVQPQIVSVRQLKFDDRTVQGAFNAEFSLPEPPPAVNVLSTALDQEIILEWNSETGDLDDILDYTVESPFAPPSAPDRTYDFEGFKVIQYRSPADQNGVIVATFDIQNNVTTVVDEGLDTVVGEVVTQVVAQGADTGVQTSISLTTDIFTNAPLRNGTSYYYGVQPYAVNNASTGSKVFAAPVTRVEVRPTRVGAVATNVTSGTPIPADPATGNVGGGTVTARVYNPAEVTSDGYRVEFFGQTVIDDHGTPGDPSDDTEETVTSYRIVNVRTGQTVFGGEEYYEEFGTVPPQTTDVFQIDGLAFDVEGPPNAPLSAPGADPAFVEITGPGGIDACGAEAASTGGCPLGNWVYGSYNSTSDYVAYHQGDGPEASIGAFAPNEYEIRFTEEGSYGFYGFSTGRLIEVPFEIWDIGLVPPGTENDPSDDVQMIPVLYADAGDDAAAECEFAYNGPPVFNGLGNSTQRIYGYYPIGEDYAAFEAAAAADVAASADGCAGYNPDTEALIDFDRGRPLQRFILVDASGADLDSDLDGTVIRFYTTDPNQIGDSFTVNTADFAAVPAEEQDADAQEAALDLIAITPNPYRGYSGYETSGNQTIARFVNLPAQATIRIFTLSGTLVRTIEKNSGTATIDWNLRTEAGLPVASGMYLIHVEARRADGSVIGERVLKFGVIQRRTQLDVL